MTGPTLIVLGGLPGTGKTTIARALAARIGAVHVRIDSIEQAILRKDGTIALEDMGYRVGYAVAADNLQLGSSVVADSVNPISLSRDAWRDVATRVGVPALEVEVVCSDAAAHRARVETRIADIAGHKLPNWAEVAGRHYEPWARERLVVDTARDTVEACVARIVQALDA